MGADAEQHVAQVFVSAHRPPAIFTDYPRIAVHAHSGLRNAVEYMGGMWNSGLLRFLDDPHVPIDNNGTERALRGVVIGRKNHYGSRSQHGTEVAALFYRLVESAKLAGVGPHTYLRAATHSALRSGQVLLPHQLTEPLAHVRAGTAVKTGWSEVLRFWSWSWR